MAQTLSARSIDFKAGPKKQTHSTLSQSVLAESKPDWALCSEKLYTCSKMAREGRDDPQQRTKQDPRADAKQGGQTPDTGQTRKGANQAQISKTQKLLFLLFFWPEPVRCDVLVAPSAPSLPTKTTKPNQKHIRTHQNTQNNKPKTTSKQGERAKGNSQKDFRKSSRKTIALELR